MYIKQLHWTSMDKIQNELFFNIPPFNSSFLFAYLFIEHPSLFNNYIKYEQNTRLHLLIITQKLNWTPSSLATCAVGFRKKEWTFKSWVDDISFFSTGLRLRLGLAIDRVRVEVGVCWLPPNHLLSTTPFPLLISRSQHYGMWIIIDCLGSTRFSNGLDFIVMVKNKYQDRRPGLLY